MSTKKLKRPTGRAVIDHRGDSKWEWLTQTGRYTTDIDTEYVRALGNGLSLVDEHDKSPTAKPLSLVPDRSGGNPYDSTKPARTPQVKRRRSLDDMRKLSEAIQRAKKYNGEKR